MSKKQKRAQERRKLESTITFSLQPTYFMAKLGTRWPFVVTTLMLTQFGSTFASNSHMMVDEELWVGERMEYSRAVAAAM